MSTKSKRKRHRSSSSPKSKRSSKRTRKAKKQKDRFSVLFSQLQEDTGEPEPQQQQQHDDDDIKKNYSGSDVKHDEISEIKNEWDGLESMERSMMLHEDNVNKSIALAKKICCERGLSECMDSTFDMKDETCCQKLFGLFRGVKKELLDEDEDEIVNQSPYWYCFHFFVFVVSHFYL